MARSSRDNLPRGVTAYRNGYRVRLFVDGVQHHLGTFDVIGDAKAALAIAKSEKARGTFVAPAAKRAERRRLTDKMARQAVTLNDWSETWLEGLRLGGGAESSNVTHRSVLRAHILPALGEMRLTEITPSDVEHLIATLQALPSTRYPGRRDNGIAGPAARTLRACLNAAVATEAGGLTTSPFRMKVASPRRVRPDDPDGDIATPEQVEALTAAMPKHWRIAIPLAAWCAMRVGEVLGLERRDLEHLDDPDRATLHIRRQLNSKTRPPSLTEPKSGSRRSIAIPAFLLPALREHIEQHAAPGREGSVLTSATRRQGRISQTAFDKAWREAREVAGRPALHFHSLRHTGLTMYAREGATLAELLHRGGHTDVGVALRYQHATAERDRTLTARLSSAVELE